MKAVFQRDANRRQHPLVGMLVALGSICVFLAMLVALTAVVHFIVM